MTDREYNAQTKRIAKMCAWYKENLGLRHWLITYEYCRGPIKDHEDSEGTCQSDWKYREAHIRFNLEQLAGYVAPRAEDVVAHEHIHCLLNEMRHYHEEGGIKHEERVASDLTMAFRFVLEEGRKVKA